MAERDWSVYRHAEEQVKQFAKASEFPSESMQGQAAEERMHAAGSVEGAQQAVIDWAQLRGAVERDHLEEELESIAMQGMRTLSFASLGPRET